MHKSKFTVMVRKAREEQRRKALSHRNSEIEIAADLADITKNAIQVSSNFALFRLKNFVLEGKGKAAQLMVSFGLKKRSRADFNNKNGIDPQTQELQVLKKRL